MEKTGLPKGYTYTDLWRFHVTRLNEAQKSDQEFRNHSSALNLFCGVAGKTIASGCGNDFSDRFESILSRMVELLVARGLATASIANKVSYIRAIRETYRVMLYNVILTGNFREVLAGLCEANNITPVMLAKAIGAPKGSVHSWISRGSIPKATSRENIHKIERFFNLSAGSLVSKIYAYCTSHEPREEKTPRLESRVKRYNLSKDHYIYKEPNLVVRKEWLELLNFYTAPYLLNGLERNTIWRVKDAENVTTYCGWEAQTSNGVCVTAHIRWMAVASFLGFLIRDKEHGGKGMDENNLSLALLTDARLLIDYIEFKRERSGRYTGEIERILAFWSSLLREHTGFLWQHAQYGKRLPAQVKEEDWQNWCNENNNSIHAMMKGFRKGGHIQKGRNPQEPIEDILAENNPIKVLVKMTERMARQVTLEERPILKAIRKRNLLLVKMLISNPLRVHHFSIMTYRQDNKGNLYQDSSGAWHLRFRPDDFKNQRGAASGEYDVAFPEWLNNDIREYLFIYRNILANPQESDRVFLPSKAHGRGKNKLYWEPNKISGCVRELTKKFIPGSPGFGTHAFRHIVATDYIKNNPNGFQIVANILHDRLDTVMKEYAHLKVADGFSHWSLYLEDQVAMTGGHEDE